MAKMKVDIEMLTEAKKKERGNKIITITFISTAGFFTLLSMYTFRLVRAPS